MKMEPSFKFEIETKWIRGCKFWRGECAIILVLALMPEFAIRSKEEGRIISG